MLEDELVRDLSAGGHERFVQENKEHFNTYFKS